MGGALAMTRVLASGERPDAVFVASDLMARGAYAALREKGIEPGRDIAVMEVFERHLARRVQPARAGRCGDDEDGAGEGAHPPHLREGQHGVAQHMTIVLEIVA
jgi:hypothetical protein